MSVRRLNPNYSKKRRLAKRLVMAAMKWCILTFGVGQVVAGELLCSLARVWLALMFGRRTVKLFLRLAEHHLRPALRNGWM